MNRKYCCLALSSAALLWSSTAHAEDDDATVEASAESGGLVAVPDRPTFSAAAAAVPAGHAQIEAGGEFASEEGSSQISFPVLLRLGVAEAFEVRAGLPAPIIPLDGSDAGFGTLQLGAKVAGDVTDSLSLGAMPFFELGTATDDQTTWSQSTYGFMGLWGIGLTDDLSIGGNAGASIGPGATEESGPRELFFAASLATSYSFGLFGLTLEGFTVLGEYADPNVGGSLSAGYAILDHLVVDVYGGTSAAGDAQTVFAGAGVTFAR